METLNPLSDKTKTRLGKLALEARQRAYAPYSKFAVGAALLDAKGNFFSGCNIENASLGLTLCAERVAIFNAVSSGSREFAALALSTEGGHMPRGACRQVLAEFCDDLTVFVGDVKQPGTFTETRLSSLLPGRFSLPS